MSALVLILVHHKLDLTKRGVPLLNLALGAMAWQILSAIVVGQSSYPMIMSLKPIAIQAGATTECSVSSRYTMLGAYQLSVGGEHVTAEIVAPELPPLKPGEKPKDITDLKVKFTVAAEALPGVREFRLMANNGASTIGQLVIVKDPVVVEIADNDSIDKAQSINLPSSLCGVIEKAEDIDCWKFSAREGQFVSFHVRCQRLQDKIHDMQAHADPILFLRDASKSVMAMSDNTFFADPCLTYRFDKAGEYFLEIRDVRYQGNVDWAYCIEANSRPFVTSVFPKAVKAGSEVTVEASGFGIPIDNKGVMQIPAQASNGMIQIPVLIGGETSNPVGVYVTDLPISLETSGDNQSVATASSIGIPQVVAGRIETPSDLDCFSFNAKKGEKLSFEIIARRQMSNIDSFIRILNDQGQALREDDDGYFARLTHADTWIENWEAPADGRFIVEVRDAHLRGGPGFDYALKITRTVPYFTLEIDTDKTQLTPGTFGSIFVRVIRKHGFTGEIQLHIDNRPTGVTATCGRILAGKGIDGCISLQASTDAKLSASNVRIWGTAVTITKAEDGMEVKNEHTATAIPFQEYYSPGGGRGHYPVETHTVAIGTPSDLLAVNLSESEIRLKPGESKKILITLQRAPSVNANVTLDFLYRHLDSVYANSLPEGVTIDGNQSKTLLTGSDTEGYITLKADPSAPPVERHVNSVMANFAINFVMKATYSSPPIFVSVEKP